MDTVLKIDWLQKFIAAVFITSFVAISSAYAVRPAQVFSGPIVVDDAYVAANGNVITGNYQGTATAPAITITTTQPIVILNTTVQGPFDLISGTNSNVTVLNSMGIGTNPNVQNVQKGIFLRVNNPVNILVQNCVTQGVRLGIFLQGYAGDFTHNNTVSILSNVFNNIDARPSDGFGSYFTTRQYNGQAVHLGNMNGVPDMEIGWNEVINLPNQSSTGALIEFNESGGTAASPTIVHDNYIQGAFPTYPGRDLYEFGGILMNGLPDDTATFTTSYVNIYNNSIVATANYGIAIVAGNNNNVYNNRVVSSGFTSTGAFYPMSTYGAAFGALNINLFNQSSTVFFNNTISNNILGLIKNNGSGGPIRSDWSLPGQSGNVDGNTDFLPDTSSSPTLADEANELVLWQAKLKKSHHTVGLTHPLN
jgi:hypothetical protein